MKNTNANIVEFTLAVVDKVGAENAEWLAEWYPELFEYPCEGWRVEEFYHLFEDMDELKDYFEGDFFPESTDEEVIETLSEDYFIIWDSGLNGILVIE